MKTRRLIALLSGSLLASVLAAPAATDCAQAVRDFSANRHRLIQELSTRLDLPLPPETESFFQAAEAGDWPAVSNQFAALKTDDPCHPVREALMNELWAPIHETLGLYEVWIGLQENPALASRFADPILDSMPAGSIYFGGTDAGRFLITAVNALREPPPVFCLTQNGLADNTYMAHLRALYGDRIWLPTAEDSNAAFKQYVDDVKAGRIQAGAEIAFKDGKVQVEGVAGVMMINSILARMIFDRNKDAHPFFVEESYVVNWMYPYLEPQGLILKLNPEPLKELSPETIARDRQFWADYEAKLFASPGFANNKAARKIFSKLRSAGAGVYDYRRLYAEAEAAFRQAIRLDPTMPEANFRFAQMLANQQRMDEAIRILEDFLAADPAEGADAGKEYLSNLMKTKLQNKTNPDSGQPQRGSSAIQE